MRMILAALIAATAAGGPAEARCFDDCFASKMQTNSDDIAAKDFALQCRATCDAEAEAELQSKGLAAQVKACKAERLSLGQFRAVRAASPSYRVQSNIFLWDVVNPYPDKVITRIEVSTQTMELNELAFTGTGLVPPSSAGTFVIPSFYEGYPAVRFSAKVSAIWACEVK
jgi:hypothetical protein